MLLTESHGKALFRSAGIQIPNGQLASTTDFKPRGAGPWIVKAQVPVGGRGKAGGIIRCDSSDAVRAALQKLLGLKMKGHTVHSCLVESAVASSDEYYLSLVVDPAQYALRATLLTAGGVDVEQAALGTSLNSRQCGLDEDEIAEAIRSLAKSVPEQSRASVVEIGRKLGKLLLQRELTLVEINPLFVAGNQCIAGDAKLVVDLNAIQRQPEIKALIVTNPVVYPDAIRKLADGFDYVEIDADGEIGLITTGAGLSMLLIDELTARGARPLNFCDIRTGQFRGDPGRLIKVLEWISARQSVRTVLVNIFAGITDLSEFSQLFCAALDRVPLRVPIVARLVGHRAEVARNILTRHRPDIVVEEDLEAALDRIDGLLKARPA